MSKNPHMSRFRAFFSIDAAFALLLCIMLLAAFASLLVSTGNHAQAASEGKSSSLLALRLSQEALIDLEAKGGGFDRPPHRQSWVIGPALPSQQDADFLASRAGRNASISVSTQEGELISLQSGTMGPSAYCATRLALYSGTMAKLRVCIS